MLLLPQKRFTEKIKKSFAQLKKNKHICRVKKSKTMVNKVILVGNVGQDPEMKETANGLIARCSLATSEKYKDKLGSGTTQTKTEWHRLTFFHPLSEVVNQYVHKGDTIYVEGKLSYSEYTDKDGNKRYATEIQVRDLKMLGGRKDDSDKPRTQSTQPLAAKQTNIGTQPAYAAQPDPQDPPF